MDTPKRRDKDATRATILNAAEHAFAESGMAGTSLSQVAQSSGVAKSLIHHHFGSKRQLWDAVKRRLLGEYFAMQRIAMEERAADTDPLGLALGAYFKLLQRRPRLARLAGWSLLEGNEPGSWFDASLNEATVQRIRDAQREGQFRDDVDPIAVLMLFFAATVHYFEAKSQFLSLFAGDGHEMDESYLNSIVRIFRRGLTPAAAAVAGADAKL